MLTISNLCLKKSSHWFIKIINISFYNDFWFLLKSKSHKKVRVIVSDCFWRFFFGKTDLYRKGVIERCTGYFYLHISIIAGYSLVAWK